MKKLIVFFIVVLALFVSCSGGDEEILSLEIFSDDLSFQLIPDYDVRTVKVVYNDAAQFQSEGLVGGEYFDRFEQLLKFVRGKNLKVLTADNSEKFYLGVGYKTGKEKFVLFEGQRLEFVKDFYDDLFELMTTQESV